MKRTIAISLILILGTSTISLAQFGQAQQYQINANNGGLALGSAGVGAVNAAVAGAPQHNFPATQGQVGGVFQVGAAGGIQTAAGFGQNTVIGAGQVQNGIILGPVVQEQGQSVDSGQIVGKTGGAGAAGGLIVAGAAQGQQFGPGMQQGSAVVLIQGAAVIGGYGSTGIAGQHTTVDTYQVQTRFAGPAALPAP